MKCPNCGANLDIDQTRAHFAVCGYCQSSIIVDREALKLSGKMAVLRPPLGPLALGFTGSIAGRGFGVLGRVRYAYEAGFWDEWYLQFEDGDSGWISQDEDRLALEELSHGTELSETYSQLEVGDTLTLKQEDFVVREFGVATLEAAEGQLPFPITPGEKHPYIDLVGPEGSFATIEIDGQETRCFLGKQLAPKDLRVDQEFSPDQEDSLEPEHGGRDGQRQRVVKKSGRELALNCESCGGSLEHPEGNPDSLTCNHCGATVDLTLERVPCPNCSASVAVHNPEKAVQLTCQSCHANFELNPSDIPLIGLADPDKKRPSPFIPIGSPCHFFGHDYRVVGYLKVYERDEGVKYFTEEYLLFSHTAGYRWLSEYAGHFTFFKELEEFPKVNPKTLRRAQSFEFKGSKWKVLEKGTVTIDAVDGELPWVATIGDRNRYADAIQPPSMLSAEWTDNEISWSKGKYVYQEEVAQAFGIGVKKLPRARGVGACQKYVTTPFKKQSLVVMIFFCCLSILLLVWSTTTGQRHENEIYLERTQYDQEFVTEEFEIATAPCLVEFEFRSNVNNEWVYLDVALVDEENRAVMDFSTQMSYYHGPDWSEGNREDTVPVRVNKPGLYKLLVKGVAGSGETADSQLTNRNYNVTVVIREKIILSRYFVILSVFCLAWIFIILIPKLTFEGKRWSE